MKNKRHAESGAAVRWSERVGRFLLMRPCASCANLAVWRARYRLKTRKLGIQCLILFHKALYRFYLARKCVVLAYSRLRVRLSLLKAERKLIAKYGRNWRSGVLNYERIEAVKTFENVHARMRSNDPSSATRPTRREPALR